MGKKIQREVAGFREDDPVRLRRAETTISILRSMKRPFSCHDRFFSSLKQVETRLASEASSATKPSPPPETSSSDPLCSPLFLDHPCVPRIPESSTSGGGGGPPLEFLSNSPPTYFNLETKEESIQRSSLPSDTVDDGDNIEQLMALLGLSGGGGMAAENSWSCHCSGGGFYERIAGVKGPRCQRETRRLDDWIQYYGNSKGLSDDGNGERREPARLAYLLLAKAACLGGEDDGDGGFEFPSTVEEFLRHDPPLPPS